MKKISKLRHPSEQGLEAIREMTTSLSGHYNSRDLSH